MRCSRALAWLIGLGLAAGCLVDGSLGRAESGGEGSTSADGTGPTSGDADATGATSAGTADGGGEGGSGGAEGGSDGSGSDGTGGLPLPTPETACEPTDHDSECATCRKGHCCEWLQACAGYDPCFCMWECLLAPEHDEVACADHCGYDSNILTELRTCTEAMCSGVCSDGLDAHPSHDTAPG